MRLTITPRADRDLDSIAEHIAKDSPRHAVRFIKELRGQCERIALNPPSYRRRPELGGDIRSCAHGNYVIFFTDTPDEVTIIRIIHGARDLPAVFGAVGGDRS